MKYIAEDLDLAIPRKEFDTKEEAVNYLKVMRINHAERNRLPTWQECSELHEAGLKMSALQQFIYSQEPAGNDGELFREQLTEVLK